MKDDLVYHQHILLESIDKIERYLKDTSFESFMFNDMQIDAVVRELEIIGEAANNVSEQFQSEHPAVPWSEMVGMRNRLIHEYFGVNTKIVWETCQSDLKDLKKFIKPLIAG
jgi:uncharacterized protein with HEPN domain